MSHCHSADKRAHLTVDSCLCSRAAVSRFYYDLALSTSNPQLQALLAFADPSRIVYGSDFPYAPKLGIYAGFRQYANFASTDAGQMLRPAALSKNASSLLSKHAQARSLLPSHGKSNAAEEDNTDPEGKEAMEGHRILSSL